MIVDGLERVEEADRLILGERDPSLIGEHVSCPGALGPVVAFGLNELEAGVRAAGIERVQ